MNNKPFQTLDSQLSILENRKLQISDKNEAKKILSTTNYYNIVNGYKKPFLKRDLAGNIIIPEEFCNNCTFEELVSLYELDRDLKRKIFEYLLLFERILKTRVAYKFSEYNQEDYPYLNIKNYSNNSEDITRVLSVVSILSKKINQSNKPSIEHYIHKHNCLPLWVLINELTLGETSYFYSALDSRLKDEIAKIFSLEYSKWCPTPYSITSEILEDIIKISIFYRNICAHDNILLLFKMKRKIKTANITNLLARKSAEGTLLNNISFLGENLYDLICILKLVLEKSTFEKLVNDLEEIFDKYNQRFLVVSLKDILLLGGFQGNDPLKELLK
ncbi:Abi-like protein [Fusobacterium necrophorum subsp. funduliforme]|uniref:Abi family protein n=1 Tax=Fusobacterium necrophorum TaxID=859 RepID=UPI0007886931|nr:Abi family protein [Fusobacterium necrophorum]AVQ20690.1 DNA-binding protein [Fusobacterium necrophorum subsp. funduliforme]AYV94371.1 Abi family protein [Fusobacterium necrophorum subsp. funduliforme]KYL04280.1 hypothetical protein A2J06_01360 [Fusobacterium necrophorum subsp. funduliforme]KYM51115.1 hypothetical protein A2U04_01875 [Fusobacterium necrophorum subsp. funduliforme]MDK4472372.1 Abi family protein [Fusobacterium necrophorum]